MIIDKSGVEFEDYSTANKIISTLKEGRRMIGNPAMGLKKTLELLESKKPQAGKTDFVLSDSELQHQISLTKAGIKGEKKLAEFISQLVKYDPDFKDIIVFASLSCGSADEALENHGHIPDSDFLVLYGNHVLILDAKNIRTTKDKAYYIENNLLLDATNNTILELHSASKIWMNEIGNKIRSFNEWVVIVNSYGISLLRNATYWNSKPRPIHVVDLKMELKEWIEECKRIDKEYSEDDGSKGPRVSLKFLIQLCEYQIKQNAESKDIKEFSNLIRATFKI